MGCYGAGYGIADADQDLAFADTLGAVGTIVNVLAEGARRPDYVKFKGNALDWNFAAEVLIEKSKNPEIVWKDLQTVGMGGKEVTVLIPRQVMDDLEIEH